MGARVSVSDEAKARSNAIDRQIEEESRNRRQVNMLLLGPSFSHRAAYVQFSTAPTLPYAQTNRPSRD